jgi:hypothetical protein
VADKFKIRVEEIIKQNPIDANLLSERVKSAKTYFAKKILDDAFKPLQGIETNLKPKQDDVFYQIFNMLNITVSLPIECLCPIGKGAEIA